MAELLCLVHMLTRAGKDGIPAKCSYSYKYKGCKCENCKLYKKESAKKHRLENKEKIKVKKSIYYKNNKEDIRKRQLIYEKNNIEKVKRYKSEYFQKNKSKGRESNRRREAKKRNNGFEKYTEKQVIELYGIICYLCNKPIDMVAPRLVGKNGWENGFHIEHVIDIAFGGPDTLDNVRPSHAICNLRKKPVKMV